MKSTKFLSIIKAFRDYYVSEPMISLGNSFELSALFRSHGWRFIFMCFPKIRKITHRLKILKIFSLYILSLTKRHGQVYMVKYLKHSTLAIQKFIAGNPLSSLKELDNLPFPRLANGLPRFIPIDDRKAIRRGDANIIRFWISLYSIYRIISIPGILKLSTITDVTSSSIEDLKNGSSELRAISQKFKAKFDKSLLEKKYTILPLETASPSSKVSWLEMFKIPSYLKHHNLAMYNKMVDYMDLMGLSKLSKQFVSFSDVPYEGPELMIGRLATKNEPAGKVRVFAMVDVWTQSILNPLHKMLFAFLKGLPNDGTFDQHAAVMRCKEKAKVAGLSFGYDLSAATDRLPISLQVSILEPIIGIRLSELWKDILVGRPYYLKNEDNSYSQLYYGTGQPMGALSSWAMLAITHHFIVQLSYIKAYSFFERNNASEWFDNYEVLGDDIVIFDEKVAKQYLLLMESYGVAINLSKSVISNNGSFDFAKVSSYKGMTVSAIPWRMLISNNTRLGRINNVLFLLKTINVKNVCSYIDKVLKHKRTTVSDTMFNYVGILSMFLSSKKITYSELLKALISFSPLEKNTYSHLSRHVIGLNKTYLGNLLVSLLNGEQLQLSNNDRINHIYGLDSYFHRDTLIDRLLTFKDNGRRFDTLQLELTTSILRKLVDPDFPDAFDVTNNLVILDEKSNNFFWLTYATVCSWFDGFTDFYLHLDGSVLSRCSLDKLVELNEQFDSFITLSELVLRANRKESGEASGAKVLKDYNLKALNFIIKSNKDRPLFTYSPLEVQMEFERIEFWWKF